MGDKTGIEWTDKTWNPIVGCSVISPACTNYYAMAMAARLESMAEKAAGGSYGEKKVALAHYAGTTKRVNGKPVWTGVLKQAPEHILTLPMRWKKARRIFVNSMSDLFHESVPDEWIDFVFAIMALAPQHTFQVLTKRPKRMREYFGGNTDQTRRSMVNNTCFGINQWLGLPFTDERCRIRRWPLPNVWLGVTAEDQPRADERIPDLLATPAAVRFVSYEPALGPIDWKRWLPTRRYARRPNGVPFLASYFFMTRCEHCGWVGSSELCGIDSFGDDSDVFCPACAKSICADDLPRLDWVICGGESGPNARPMHPDWARSLRDQCAAAGVPFFFKKWGEYGDFTDARRPRCPDLIFAPDGEVLGAGDGRRGSVDEDWREKGGAWMVRIGKSRAGRLLDGREHNEFPEARS